MKTVAIIGAGMAGLAAARALITNGITSVVFEKSRGLGGRAATRRVDNCCFDHGAQYVKSPSKAIQDLIAATGDAVLISRPIWVLTADNQIVPGDRDANEQKWTWPTGITRLAKYLAADLVVQSATTVASLYAFDHGYRLYATDGRDLGQFDAVILTAPAPQSAAILAAGNPPPTIRPLIDSLQMVQYRRLISITVAYPNRPAVPWYAVVNADRQHAISWLACEHDKPGRAPATMGLLIAQMSDHWATTHWDSLTKGTFVPDATLPQPISEVLSAIRQLVGDLGPPQWIDVQRWRYALPYTTAPVTAAERIVLAGDLVTGQGRVHLAIESGWRAAEQIQTLLS